MYRLLFLMVSATTLAGCSPLMDATVQTVRTAAGGEAAPDAARLNPAFRYLRVTIEGRTAFLALGNVEPHPRGPVEVWYSAQREVLRLQNGRLVGAVGLTTEWREVVLPELPSWSSLAGGGAALRLTRTRDVMPGYRYNVRDALVLRATAPPEKSALVGLDPGTLAWFEERFEAGRPAGMLEKYAGVPDDRTLPPARYAVSLRDGKDIVVYGEQCLAPAVCFTWQRWEVKP